MPGIDRQRACFSGGSMRWLTGHQHGARRRACGCNVVVCEASGVALRGKLVDVGCLDLRAEAAAVAETQIVRYNHQEVGPLLCHDEMVVMTRKNTVCENNQRTRSSFWEINRSFDEGRWLVADRSVLRRGMQLAKYAMWMILALLGEASSRLVARNRIGRPRKWAPSNA